MAPPQQQPPPIAYTAVPSSLHYLSAGLAQLRAVADSCGCTPLYRVHGGDPAGGGSGGGGRAGAGAGGAGRLFLQRLLQRHWRQPLARQTPLQEGHHRADRRQPVHPGGDLAAHQQLRQRAEAAISQTTVAALRLNTQSCRYYVQVEWLVIVKKPCCRARSEMGPPGDRATRRSNVIPWVVVQVSSRAHTPRHTPLYTYA